MGLGFRGWLNLIMGMLFLGQSVLPMVGINFVSLGRLDTYVLLVGLVLVVLDGFRKEHALKMVTLVTALLLAILMSVPLLYSAGWLPFTLPSGLMFLYPWVLAATGLLMVIGAFTRG